MPIYKLNDKEPSLPNDESYWIAPDANIIGDVKMEMNSSVWFSATLRGDCEQILVGENSNVQDGSVLHTDFGFPLIIGRNVTIGHQVMLHGCSIGDNSLIGMGSIVTKDIRSDVIAYGFPAKIIKHNSNPKDTSS